MQPLYLYTLFDKKDGKPLLVGIKNKDSYKLCTIWRSGKNEPVSKILATISLIKRLIENATPERPVVLSGFKDYIAHFKLDLRSEPYHVYDLHLPDINPKNLDHEKRHGLVRQVLDRIGNRPILEYQRVLANSAVVYQSMEASGLCINDMHFHPQWSLRTFSGRGKSYGFNIQGFHEPHTVTSTNAIGKHALVHFDWVCADIRVASIMSGDERLQESFMNSDPYTTMLDNIVRIDRTREITRDDCKLTLLRTINSMNYLNPDVLAVYPDLCLWIKQCKSIIDNQSGSLESILGRKFQLAFAKNKLAVLNGIMQGSVAHAMQNILRKVWEILPRYLVADIHDSLVMSVPVDAVGATIDAVAPIMLRPFTGLLEDDPAFPVKVSVGDVWKRWKTTQIHRASGVQYVEESETEIATDDQPQEEFEFAEAEETAAGAN